MRTKRVCLFGTAAICALTLTGCGTQKTVSPVPSLIEPANVRVDTAAAAYQDLYTLTTYDGCLSAVSEELAFEINGTLAEILVYPGEEVEAGQVLMTLDQSALEREILSIEDEIAYTTEDGEYADRIAQLEIDALDERIRLSEGNAPELAEERAMKALQLKQAQEERALQLEMLNAKLAQKKRDFGLNTIIAPFRGNVCFDESLRVGDTMRAGTTVIDIADTEHWLLRVPERVNLANVPEGSYYARIGGDIFALEYIPVDDDMLTAIILNGGNAYTECRVLDAEQLSAGQYAALCVVSNMRENVLTVPAGALHRASGVSYVYVDHDGQRERREVTIGRGNGLDVEIVEGLTEGEIVYVQH